MGTDINTMIEVRLANQYQDHELWVCAGSVDHFIGRNRDVYEALGNVGHWQNYEIGVSAGSVAPCHGNCYGIKPISCGRLTRKVVLTDARIAEDKKHYEEDEQYRNDYPSLDAVIKDTYMYALHFDYGLSWAFIDRLIANWEDGKCSDPAYVSHGCHDQSFVTLKEMMDYVVIETGDSNFGDLWSQLIDFLRKTGELYEQTNPERIRLCFFFDS